ncbi:helix-turn-helix transcriptional regulator [Streptomyces sp. NPDC004528]|uniref:helix-turn-helix transcriptional regulator n=1 Tax=Streptomyces sp. NPDC004528 TaxID=3154550 RepID=UPI0033ABE572
MRAEQLPPAHEEMALGVRLSRDGPVSDAHNLLLLAADSLRTTDADRSREAGVHAVLAAWSGGDRDGCLAALDTLCPEGPPRDGTSRADHDPVETFWRAYRDGMRGVLNGDFGRAATLLRPVLDVLTARQEASRLLSAGTIALMLGDLGAARQVLGLALATARRETTPVLLPRVLEHLAYAELREGRYHQARVHAEAGLEAAAGQAQRNVTAGLSAVLALAASIAGDPATVATHARSALRIAHAHGLGQARTLAEWARARADLGHGHAEHAAARLAPLVQEGPRQGHFGLWMMAVPCYVEAAVLAGHDLGTGTGTGALTGTGTGTDVELLIDRYARWASLGADPQAPAVVLRCRALVAGDEHREDLFGAALARHENVDSPYEHARTHLAYGMWLRRRRRPGEARAQLRRAVMGFDQCGADVWTARADAELRAAGETPVAAPSPASGAAPLTLLTPQQLRIARSVALGATNREVARQLSISTRTVEYHLRNIFTHLGVRSRVALARCLGPDLTPPGRADGSPGPQAVRTAPD